MNEIENRDGLRNIYTPVLRCSIKIADMAVEPMIETTADRGKRKYQVLYASSMLPHRSIL
jgi:hypothetical protein